MTPFATILIVPKVLVSKLTRRNQILPALAVLPAALALPASAPADIISPSLYPREYIPRTSSLLTRFTKRQSDSCAETCGTVCYTQATIDDAVSTGYKLYQQNNTDDSYPHTYRDDEVGSTLFPQDTVSLLHAVFVRNQQSTNLVTYISLLQGFKFPVDGPYQEFPILKTFKAYDGGSPGPDRVIFNTEGQLAGTITHTGTSDDKFVACQDGSSSGDY